MWISRARTRGSDLCAGSDQSGRGVAEHGEGDCGLRPMTRGNLVLANLAGAVGRPFADHASKLTTGWLGPNEPRERSPQDFGGVGPGINDHPSQLFGIASAGQSLGQRAGDLGSRGRVGSSGRSSLLPLTGRAAPAVWPSSSIQPAGSFADLRSVSGATLSAAPELERAGAPSMSILPSTHAARSLLEGCADSSSRSRLSGSIPASPGCWASAS